LENGSTKSDTEWAYCAITGISGSTEELSPATRLTDSASTHGKAATLTLAGLIRRPTKRALASIIGLRQALSMKDFGRTTKRMVSEDMNTLTKVSTLDTTTMTSPME